MGSTSSHGSRVHGPIRVVRRRAGGGQRRGAAPEAEVSEDFFHHRALVNDGNHSHRMLTLRADQRVCVPHLEDDIAPLFRGRFGGRRRGAGRAQGSWCRAAVLRPLALTTHLVGIPAVVTDHLRAFVGDVLGDGGQEIGGSLVAVAEGTGAIRAYEAMVYGLEKEDAKTKEKWKRLLLQYCKLDTLSMVFIWQHWKRLAAAI